MRSPLPAATPSPVTEVAIPWPSASEAKDGLRPAVALEPAEVVGRGATDGGREMACDLFLTVQVIALAEHRRKARRPVRRALFEPAPIAGMAGPLRLVPRMRLAR
jgi:hypothetical protein